MKKISREKNSRINKINNNYSKVSFLAQFGLIKNEQSNKLKMIALSEMYKFKFGLKDCFIKISRIDKVKSTVKIVKRKIKIKRDENFLYF